ncbi:hypothetical protein [Parapedobacter lycopersici]|uniref:hypothetical protein n=1 Tax=Parapedobacter lycopersici TaxID=1864939 RepID=UPI00214DE8A5|nr:hypothetical protein [Parapedobacter lycopersici]
MKRSNRPLLMALITLIAAISACRNEASHTAADDTADSAVAEPTETPPTLPAPAPALPYTAVFNDRTDQLDAQANPDFDRTGLNIDTLTRRLALAYPEIQLRMDRVSNDTAYVRIADAEYLTQQMGSSGATMYLLEATYAYTELPGIRVVHFDFREGDHAIPGAYTRQRFAEEALR